AAGPTDLVEVLNAEFVTYTKTGSREFTPKSLDSYFATVDAGLTPFDPVARYRAGHFYLVALVQDTGSETSRIVISVSQTSAGNGAWCNYFVDATTGSGGSLTWADFPQVGVTSN